MVVGDDVRLSWVMDTFTVSNNYSYSTHYNLGESPVNYMRNSVKLVVDAYTGSTTLYVFDSEDPILDTYAASFRVFSKTPQRVCPATCAGMYVTQKHSSKCNRRSMVSTT